MAQPHRLLVLVAHVPEVSGGIAAPTVSTRCHAVGVLQLNPVPVQRAREVL